MSDERIDGGAAAMAAALRAAAEAARKAAEEAARKAAEEAARKAAEEEARKAAADQARAAAANERLAISANPNRGGGYKKEDELTTGQADAYRAKLDTLLSGRSREAGPALPTAKLDLGDLPAELRRFKLVSGVQPQAEVRLAADAAALPQAGPKTDVDQSVDRVQTAAKQDPAQAARVAREEAEKLNDPAKTDELIKRTQAELDEAAKRATPDSVRDFVLLTQKAGPDGVGRVADALAKPLANGQFSDGPGKAIVDGVGGDFGSGDSVRLHEALVSRLQLTQPLLAEKLQEFAHTDLGTVQAGYDAAKSKYDQESARLATDLQAYGPSLTDDQKKAYVESFWKQPEHAKVKDEYQRAEQGFAHHLAENRPALEARAKAGDEGAARQLAEGYQRLAKSDHYADDALKWLRSVGDKGNEALAGTLGKVVDGGLEKWATEQIVEQAVPHAQGEALAAAEKGDESKLLGLEDVLKGFEGTIAFGKLGDALATAGSDLRLARTDPSAARLRQQLGDWEHKSTLGKTLGLAGALVSLYKAGDAAGSGEYADALKESLKGGKDAAEFASGLLGTLGAAKSSHLVEKFVPYLSIAANLVQSGKDAASFDRNNPGDYIKGVGDVVSLAGDVLSFIPGAGHAAKEIAAAVGEVVHWVGEVVSDHIKAGENQEKLQKDRAEILEHAGVDPATRDALLSLDDRSLKQLSTLGLDPRQAAEAAKFLAAGADSPNAAAGLDVAASLGLKGDEALRFARDFAEHVDPGTAEALQVRARNIGSNANKPSGEDHRGTDDDFRLLQDLVRQANQGVYDRNQVGSRRPDQVNRDYFSTTDA